MPSLSSKLTWHTSARRVGILVALAAFLAAVGISIAIWAMIARERAQSDQSGPATIAIGSDNEASRQTPLENPVIRMGPVPDPALTAQGKYGALPVTAEDGRKPWQVYARPLPNAGNRARVAIVVTDIGLNEARSRDAIAGLPPEISMAISPYAENGQDWVLEARSAGHEVLLIVPMEPINYPQDDPGPHTLLTSLSAEDNLDRLTWLMARISGYVGIINDMGSRFTAARASMQPVIESLAYRGLMLVDAQPTSRSLGATMAAENDVPRAIVDQAIDATPTEAAIREGLNRIMRQAEAYGAAVGLARPYPVTIRTLQAWAEEMDKQTFILAPVTATANRQPIR